MNPGEQTEEQARPAPETAAEPAPSGSQRRGGRGGRGRGRGRGFGRRPGGAAERAETPPPGEPARPSGGRAPAKGSTINDAVRQVERIRAELARVLDDMNHVLEILEQAERENTATDQELEKLRDSLHSLHRGAGPARFPRRSDAPPPAAKSDAPASAEPESEPTEEWD
jgi:hypothetical protein